MSGKRFSAIVLMLLASASGAAAAPPEAFDAFRHDDYATVLRVCDGPAKAGDSVCQDMLGVLYSEGLGVARDQAAAFHWFELAAAQGNPTAAYNLGVAYERGRASRRTKQRPRNGTRNRPRAVCRKRNFDSPRVRSRAAIGRRQ